MSGSCLIAPSLLSADFSCLAEEVAALESAGADALHFDVIDGHYAPSITFSTHVIAALRPKTSLFFDVHLMLRHVDSWLPAIADAGADRITIHLDSSLHPHRSLSLIRSLGLPAGIALKPHDTPESLTYLLDTIDFILVMGVNPGFSGQPFIPAVLPKIAVLQTMTASRPILLGVDGGIDPRTLPLAAKAGASFFVAGHSIFSQPSYSEAITTLRTSFQSLF